MRKFRPSELVWHLQDHGFSLRVESGKILVSPAGRLSASERDLLREYKDRVIWILQTPDGVAQAVVDEFFDDHPSDALVELRRCVLIRPEGFPPMAFSEEFFATPLHLDRQIAVKPITAQPIRKSAKATQANLFGAAS